jgi:hypothetical protein
MSELLKVESSLPWLAPWYFWTTDQLGQGRWVASQNPGDGWRKLRDEIDEELWKRNPFDQP